MSVVEPILFQKKRSVVELFSFKQNHVSGGRVPLTKLKHVRGGHVFNDSGNATRGGNTITGSALSHRPRPSLFDPLAIASLAIAPLALAPLALAPLATPLLLQALRVPRCSQCRGCPQESPTPQLAQP